MGALSVKFASSPIFWYNDVQKRKTSDAEGSICFSRHINEHAVCEADSRAEGEHASGEQKRSSEAACGTSTSMQSAKQTVEPKKMMPKEEK